MFLKSLILRGFKTFADLTEIEFQEDARITAIVGPNGCGKSNLMDATRWVLGEDNSRELRVATLSDIIFAGTATKRSLSMAEVTLVFDNTSGKLPIAFSEVGIKRRTFREGESEFFINKNLCRLKDIRDLLLDTGMGEASYSVITQGQVDSILSSKGEERRAVFEEAAGINKYKYRKSSAEKKLIAAEQNILRINDLKIEVGEQIITLEDQAGKAREYLDIQTRVKETDIGLSKKLVNGILEKRGQLSADLEKIKQENSVKREAEQKDTNELAAFKEKHRNLEIELDELLIKLEADKDGLRDIELDRRFAEGEFRREEKTLIELDNKKKDLAEKISGLKHSLEQSRTGLDLANIPHSDFFNQMIEQISHLVRALSGLITFLGKENTISLNLGGSEDKRETLKLKLEMLAEENSKIDEEKEKLTFALQAHRAQLENLSTKMTETKDKQTSFTLMQIKKKEKEDLSQNIFTLEEKIRAEEKAERETLGRETTLEIALAKLDGEIVGISERLSLEYNISMEELEALPYEVGSIAKAKMDVAAGRARLRDLEPVNLLAIEEFEKAKERLSFIEAQLIDLNSARENLRSLMAELDIKAEQDFLQTMEQVSQVFSETFSKLFVGGEARISLSTDKPALEAEIEISVRPAGRKWLPLPLLSGGERSLSAIAILFSLLKIRPSPFCFLDEVDAALDDANVNRFTEMLKDFSGQSQIIVITHNKRTMAIADNIYGVTMEEPGISKVISMKLAQAV
ncbi:hypothetical protein A2291_04295 [candidate division WOR-1 bacterium RIFOXYB2_FULL_42_35]|uniref:RecF/RecN/SMC N-terminal domain-containing protein n=1 Tax=candidate division WOR-1 bacterium RIFOXYC2_FULL_41_25 TaxID=1802586 RepID=A0A1F4TR84_UNCSA|nr:MAG: hypothetical protein A2247_07410 [candidate division WOR-1 bacterium RIFOXYA2_FULL_41_14]OGC25785.1 MAG: hypothetical protein A2291_04295 [candidate division WOR-1 bacterium RIFOXYB2_FULL_42_35]OGC35225.1 MAG: hypothetical protein A2462_08285 [candidate division WOR-1 bacterium RIFOXYC2_FULL_41_25]